MGAETRPVELPFNVSRIRWLQRHGEKGAFELSDDTGNPDHKALLKFLVDYAGGRINSEGFFYWVFPDGRVIGRKPLLEVSWKSQKSVGSLLEEPGSGQINQQTPAFVASKGERLHSSF